MARARALLDTNVLIYATLSNDKRHSQAKSLLLGQGESASLDLFISVQCLSEMWPNLTGPKAIPPDSPEVARSKIDSISILPHLTVLPIDVDTVRLAVRLCERYRVTRQAYFDMQLAATMLQNRIRLIYTENISDFSGIEGIEAINPFS